MKVKDLLKKLETINPDLDVYCTSNTGCYEYAVVHSVAPRFITIVDGDGFAGENPKERIVLIIEEQ